MKGKQPNNSQVNGILFLNEIPMPSQVIGVVAVLSGLYVFSGKWAQVNG